MAGHAVTISITHDDASQVIDAAVPTILAECLTQGCQAADAILQVLGVTGIAIHTDIVELPEPTE